MPAAFHLDAGAANTERCFLFLLLLRHQSTATRQRLPFPSPAFFLLDLCLRACACGQTAACDDAPLFPCFPATDHQATRISTPSTRRNPSCHRLLIELGPHLVFVRLPHWQRYSRASCSQRVPLSPCASRPMLFLVECLSSSFSGNSTSSWRRQCQPPTARWWCSCIRRQRRVPGPPRSRVARLSGSPSGCWRTRCPRATCRTRTCLVQRCTSSSK